MKPSNLRRIRRRAAHDTAVAKKENKQEQSFFASPAGESFFHPAPVVQRKCADCEKEEKQVQRVADKKEEEKLQKKEEEKKDEKLMKKEDKKEEEQLQKKEATAAATNTTSGTSTYINSLNGKGSVLPAHAQQFFAARMGYDFSNVKIHTDKEAQQSAKDVNAKAYTIGNNIVFNEGQYNTESTEGKELMAHELVHVVQQKNSSEVFRQTERSQTNDQSDERQIVLKWNFNEIFGDTIESIKRDTGAKLDSDGYNKLGKKLNEIRYNLVGQKNPPVIGQPVVFTLRIPNIKKCKWSDFFKCDYTITASYTEPPPQTAYAKILKQLSYCTQCLVKIWMEEGEIKTHVIKLSETDELPYAITEDERLKLTNSLEEIKQSKNNKENFLFFDRTVKKQVDSPEPPQTKQPQSCDHLEEGLKEACEINKSHTLAAVQSAEGLKSATCYGSKLDFGLCAFPMVGGLKQAKNAADQANKLQDINKIAKITNLHPNVISDLKNIASKLSDVVSKRDKTIAVGAVVIDGNLYYVYTVSRNWTNKRLRKVADQLKITRWQADLAQVGGGAHHAEQIMIEAAEVNNMKLLAITPSRPFCEHCALATGSEHIHMINP